MIEPVQILEESDRQLIIKWSDGTQTTYSAVELRQNCPCAACINEWTGEKILQDENVPESLSFSSISIVGRYALNFHFSDGHDTGIFSFQYLHQLPKR